MTHKVELSREDQATYRLIQKMAVLLADTEDNWKQERYETSVCQEQYDEEQRVEKVQLCTQIERLEKQQAENITIRMEEREKYTAEIAQLKVQVQEYEKIIQAGVVGKGGKK